MEPVERSLRTSIEVMSIAEGEERDRQYWRYLTPSERIQKLEEIRWFWLTEDERRLKPTIELVEGL